MSFIKQLCIAGAVCVLSSGLLCAQTFQDAFDVPRNYLTEGVEGTIWDGFVGLGTGETVSQLNASTTRPGELYIASANGYYAPPWNPLGPFLYKTVTEDFVAVVKITAYQDILHNTGGIMARAPRNPDLAGDGEDWVSIDYFPIWSCGNFARMADNGVRTELCHNGLAWDAHVWLQLEKKGTAFHFRHSPDGVTWTELSCSPVNRADLNGIPLQVGLFQCTYHSNTGHVAFDHFSLTTTDPAPPQFPSSAVPPLTLNPGDRLVDNSSTVKGLPPFMAGQWDTDGQTDGWTTAALSQVTVAGGVLTAAASGNAPYLERASIPNGPDLDFAYFDHLQFRLRRPAGSQNDIVIYYGTSARPFIDTASTRLLIIPAALIPQDGQWHTYRLDLGLAAWWRDALTHLRIYPLGLSAAIGQTFSIDYVEVGDLPGDVLLVNTNLNIHTGESFSDLNYMESKHAVFWWSPQSYQRHSAFNPQVMGRRALRMIEESYQVFCKVLNYDEPFESFDLWRRNGNRYKINHITWYDGFWCGGWNGFMHIGVNGSGLLDEGWGNPMPHEFGHYIQGHQLGFLTGGHWESHANFLRNARNIHYAEVLGNLDGMIIDQIFDVTNFRQDHGSLIYHDYRIHHALQDFGAEWGLPDAVADVWKFGSKEQTIYTKLASLLPGGVGVGDAVARGMRHWPFLDFSAGDTFKSIFWDNGAKEALFKYRMGSHLIPSEDRPGWYRVPFARAPERFAFMVHELLPLSSDVSVTLQGFDLVGNTEGWRWSLAATDDKWENVRFSDVFLPGTQGFEMTTGETKLFLIVVAAPTDNSLNLEWTDNLLPVDKHPDRLRYAYEVYLDGAAPAVGRRQYTTALPAGSYHANGGGFVAGTATVAATAYVGPNARVLGSARVLNFGRVEDYAVIRDTARVENNAVVSGHALVMGSARIQNFARVRDRAIIQNSIVRGNAKVEGYAGVYSSATIQDYAIVRGCSTITGGTVSGTAIADYDYSYPNTAISDGVHFSHVPWGDWYKEYWWNTLRKPRGLIASYRIEEPQGEICWDEFGAQHALLRGRPRRFNDAATNSVYLHLNGVNQYMVLDRAVCDVYTGSIVVRVKPDVVADQPVVYMGSSESAYLELALNSSGKAVFTITNGVTSAVLTSASDIPAGSWTALAVTLSGSQCVLYVNGLPEAQAATTLVPESVLGSNSYAQPEAFYVGRNRAGDLYRGGVDDIRFYNVAMMISEVQNEVRRMGTWLAAMFYDAEMDFDGAATRVESGVRHGLKRRLTAEIFPRTSKSNAHYEAIFDANDERSSALRGAGIGLNNGTFRVRLDGVAMWNTGVAVTLNQWQTIALEFDGTSARLYVDGVLRASRGYSTSAQAGKNYRIGYAVNDNNEAFYFDGKIRNLRILTLGDTVPVLSPEPDINGDGNVDILDLLELASNWLRTGCSAANQWCGMTDLNTNGRVDLQDFSKLSENW